MEAIYINPVDGGWSQKSCCFKNVLGKSSDPPSELKRKEKKKALKVF